MGFAANAVRAGEAGPVLDTSAGRVLGYANGEIKVFKGIPYGADTSGAGRFMPPRKPMPWTGVRRSVDLGNRAPQNPTPDLMPEEAAMLPSEPMSEDCLRLNVWTPALSDGRKRPIMVWFHGGGFTTGSGGSPRNDGSRLCARHDVVVVTVNHRLNVFGFLHLGEGRFADAGNVGMLDCIAALEWVRDNAAAIGGDAGNVTIFGESGGARKVSTLMAMPAARGLFHRVIAESGVALRVNTAAAATRTADLVLRHLGIARTQLDQLQAVPQQRLLDAIAAIAEPLSFMPVADGRALKGQPFDPAAPDISADVPMMVGSNTTEITFRAETPLDPIDEAALKSKLKGYTRAADADIDALIALYRRTRPQAPNHYLYQLIASDWWLTADVALQAERKAALGRAKAFVYHFAKTTPVRGGKLNSPHTLEIAYAFDTVDISAVVTGKGPERQALADRMSAAWTAFARTGDPSTPALPWPAYSAAKRSVMVLNDECRVVEDPNAEERTAITAAKARTA